MAQRTRYDGFSKGYVAIHGLDTVMPQARTRSLPDMNLSNGAPFGPFDEDKPYWPEVKEKGPKTERRRKVLKDEGRYLSQRKWSDTTSIHANDPIKKPRLGLKNEPGL